MRDLVAFFGDGAARASRGWLLHVHLVLRAVDAHLGLGVELLDGAGDGALAVAAGHALDLKVWYCMRFSG
jgi:hypothetical protein